MQLQAEGRRTAVLPFRPDVEGLRAVAVLLVLGDHLLGLPAGGFVGVDVFFVVSGFLITGLLHRELAATGRLDLRAFWVRRARRLLPAALTVLAVTAVAAQLLFLPVRAAQVARDALWASGFSANWRFAALGTDYFSSTRPPSPVQHYWSLSVEEQFYAVWPLLVLLAAFGLRGRRPLRRPLHLRPRPGRRAPHDPRVDPEPHSRPDLCTRLDLRARLTLLAGLVLVASLAVSVWQTAVAPRAAYFSTPVRAHELAAGALLALHVHRLRGLSRRAARLLSLLGLGGIAAAAVLVTPAAPFPGALALLPVAATCALLAAGAGPEPAGASRLLARPLPRYVGRLSYTLYLWHWPLLVLAAAVVPGRPWWLAVGLAAASFGLAAATSALVEEPLRHPPVARPGRRAVRLPRLALPVLLVAALLGVSATDLAGRGAAGGAATGVEPSVVALPGGGTAQTAPDAAYRTLAQAERAVADALRAREFGELSPSLAALPASAAPEWTSDGCLDVVPDAEQRCVYGSARLPRTAVLLGDSVAVSLVPGLRAALEPRGYRLRVLTRRQCALQAPDDSVSAGCREHRDRALDRASALDPDLVVVSGSYVAGARGFAESDAGAWRARAAQVLARLGGGGAPVVLLTAPPRTGNLQSCATRLGSPQDCVGEVSGVWRALAAADATAAEETGARIVDVRPWLCRDDRCPPVVDETPVAFDGRHLTAAQSRRLALLLRQALLPQR